MSYWGEVVGQNTAIATLQNTLAHAAETPPAHAWLFIGPPGSGRFNLALRFAAALVVTENTGLAATLSDDPPPAQANMLETVYNQVAQGTHPDVKIVRTQTNELSVAQMREVVTSAYFAPASGPRRVIVIEDADRMNMQAANAILKALEEPPETTIWILCSPSEADLLPTIRSRTRVLRLTTPPPETIAQLLTVREGIAPDLALQAAKLAQGHIGMAKRLASDPEVLQRRTETIDTVLNITGLNSAVLAANKLYKFAERDADALVTVNLEKERKELYHGLGLDPAEKVPRDYARQFKELEESSKRRLTRAKIDSVDRILLDILTLCRDIIMLQTGSADNRQNLINTAHEIKMTQFAKNISLQKITAFAASIETARQRLGQNINQALLLEAVLLGLITIPN